MKKLLLSTAAVVGLATVATPALAQVQLELGGYFKGYGVWIDQDDEIGGEDVKHVDFIRDTEVHFGGETTLDNGLTVGAHIEASVDGSDSFDVNESYAYFSGGWGRVNFGDEDGAAYLLQVEAPSADSNIDGLRQYVQPVAGIGLGSGPVGSLATVGALDYAQSPSGKSTKLTYLSPLLSGFQVGLTFSPDTDAADDLEGVGIDGPLPLLVFDPVTGAPSVAMPFNSVEETYEAGVRYEGQFNNVGVIVGGGYSHQEVENDNNPATASADDRKVWNVGADFDVGPFGIGASYGEDNVFDFGKDQETLAVGVDYTTGPFKLGASWLNVDNVNGSKDLEADRYSGGVTYTYGPGMTFRGSIGHVEFDTPGDDADATYLTLGTQVNF